MLDSGGPLSVQHLPLGQSSTCAWTSSWRDSQWRQSLQQKNLWQNWNTFMSLFKTMCHFWSYINIITWHGSASVPNLWEAVVWLLLMLDSVAPSLVRHSPLGQSSTCAWTSSWRGSQWRPGWQQGVRFGRSRCTNATKSCPIFWPKKALLWSKH